MKTALIVITLVVAFLAISGTLLYRSGKGWLAESETAQASAKAEAIRFAEMHDQNACVEEASKKLSVCSDKLKDFACVIGVGAFTRECLPVAKRSAGFCDDAPKTDSVWEHGIFADKKCTELGKREVSHCQQIATTIVDYCLKQASR